MDMLFTGKLTTLLRAYIKLCRKRENTSINIETIANTHFRHKLIRFENVPQIFLDMKFNKNAEFLKQYKTFNLRNDDVWIASFPKSGTTWVQELVYVIVNDGDFKKAKSTKIEKRSPLFELPLIGINQVNKLRSPRVIKTHLFKQLLPDDVEKTTKVIYCVRNPKDVAVSCFHFYQDIKEADYKGSFEDFIDEFIGDRMLFGPWWTHVNEYVSSPYVHVVFYEDLHTKPFETVRSLCDFLGKKFDDEKLNQIINWCSFENMKINPTINYNWSGLFKNDQALFRKGKIGDWRNYFTDEMSKRFDEHIEKMLKTNIKFNYGPDRTNQAINTDTEDHDIGNTKKIQLLE